MKRVFDEISDEEWTNHNHIFKPSKIINSSSSKPPIESFAFNNSPSTPVTIDLTDDGDEDFAPSPKNRNNNKIYDDLGDDDDLEDHDVDDDKNGVVPGRGLSRGRRFIVADEDDEEDDLQEVVEVKSEVGEEEEMDLFDFTDDDDDDEEDIFKEEDEDVVGKALQKCAKISAELRKDLSMSACDRYAETESSSIRIVTQDEINSAYGADDSGFQPLLKPYQLVGVNFLLLLKQKKIGGDVWSQMWSVDNRGHHAITITAIWHLAC